MATPHQLPLRKKILFSTIIVSFFFLLAEGILAVSGLDYRSKQTTLTSDQLPDGPGVRVPEQFVGQLPVSVLHNVRSNSLTYPDPDLIFKVRNNPAGNPIFGYTGINSQGFRGPEFDADVAGRKILLLGNSCAFGWDIKDYTLTFPYRLQQQLNTAGKPFTLYNLSQPGYSTTQAYQLFERWYDKIDPDVVILYLGWNDLWETPLLTDAQTMALLQLHNHWMAGLLSRTRIFAAIQQLMQSTGLLPEPPEINRLTRGNRPRVPMDESIRNLSAMLAKAPAILVLPPFCCQEKLQPMETFKSRMIQALEGKAELLRLEAMEYNTPSSHLYFSDDGFHPNELGAATIARELYQAITSEDLNR